MPVPLPIMNRMNALASPPGAPPEPHAAYRALCTRDARFDGCFFVGVTSTGIYCRPICRVRTPREANCRFFANAALAEEQGFRPCLKCRPELAPGRAEPWSVMDASQTLARQAAGLLDDPQAELPAIAARLGISDRHLRRIFLAAHGVTPLDYLQTRRLLLAKQLLTDSSLPMADVALASGFRSLRRFNDAFAQRYRMSPTRLRRTATTQPAGPAQEPSGLELRLGWRPPYDLPGLLHFFARRAMPGVEAVDDQPARLRRSVRAGVLAPTAGWIEATFLPERAQLHLRLPAAWSAHVARIVPAVRRWLDLDADPAGMEAALAGLPGTPGTRLPGALDGFELALRAVLGQRVTVAGGCRLLARLIELAGTAAQTPWPELDRHPPTPQAVAALTPEALRALGMMQTQAQTVLALAQAWPALEQAHPATGALRPPPAALVARLCELPGIGPWTAHYIAMRWLGWTDAFPPGDAALHQALGLPRTRTGEREAERQAAAWQPWRSYAVLRLWHGLETP